MKRKAILILAVVTAFTRLLPSSAAAATEKPVDIGSRLELFVDDTLVGSMSGARFELQRPQAADVSLVFDRPWEGEFAFQPTVLHYAGLYHMYYRGLPQWGEDKVLTESTCYAVSGDGIHWVRPQLGLVELKGSKENNAIFPTSGFSPFVDPRPEVPESERFKALLPSPRKNEDDGVWFYASSDGVHWKRRVDRPDPTMVGPGPISWCEAEKTFEIFTRPAKVNGDTQRKVERFVSKTLVGWKSAGMMDSGSPAGEEIYVNGTLPYFRAPHIYISLAARFMQGRQVLTEEEARKLVTRNRGKFWRDVSDGVLMTWRPGQAGYRRLFMEAFVRPGPGDSNWVTRTNYPGNGVVQTGPNEISFYVDRDFGLLTSHITRYTLRMDGFISVHAPYAGGEMVTKPLRFEGGEFVMNFATSAPGSVRVEIQDADGRPIEGYALGDCPEIIGDRIDQVVRWKNGSDVRSLAGKPVRLRFVMKDADLYSIRFR